MWQTEYELKKCFKCERTEKEVKLIDAIYENEITKICEECAITEDIPIIRKPSSFQLKTSKKPPTVYERLSKISGISNVTAKQKQESKVQEIMKKITISNSPDLNQLSIKQRQELAKKANQPLNLIDNFHWHIQMTRRKKKITQSQLAQILAEPEEAIKMIESGKLPDDANKIIRKIEQYFKINLEKSAFEAEQNRLQKVRQPARILEFDKNKIENLTIADLIEMKKKQEAIEKQTEEQIKTKSENKPEEKKQQEKNQQEPTPEELIGNEVEFIDE